MLKAGRGEGRRLRQSFELYSIGLFRIPETAQILSGDVEDRMSNRPLEDNDLGVITESDKKLAPPAMYKVLLHNDDYTTMEFVVQVLQAVFHRSITEATQIMLHIHRSGIGVAGVYTYEVAETKVAFVEALAKKNEYPLLCTMEEV
jgi:ATP-dependent Clp protease adaptor protein ClpS